MIYLDTNVLIGLLGEDDGVVENIGGWLDEGVSLGVSALVWHEFVTGPVSEGGEELVFSIFERGVEAFTREDAELSAVIFERLGKPRRRRMDVMIAAFSIRRGGQFATMNERDFIGLEEFGLRLVGVI